MVPQILCGGVYFVSVIRILSYWGTTKTFELGGLAAPQNPLLPWGGRRPPQTPRPGGKAPRTPLGRSAPRVYGEGT